MVRHTLYEISGANCLGKVRLGNSGLKVSRLILGCMSYGSKSWQEWVLEEEEGIKQITEAFKLGINVRLSHSFAFFSLTFHLDL